MRRRKALWRFLDEFCRAVEKRLGKFADLVESIFPLAPGYVHGLTAEGRLIAPYCAPARIEVCEVIE